MRNRLAKLRTIAPATLILSGWIGSAATIAQSPQRHLPWRAQTPQQFPQQQAQQLAPPQAPSAHLPPAQLQHPHLQPAHLQPAQLNRPELQPAQLQRPQMAAPQMPAPQMQPGVYPPSQLQPAWPPPVPPTTRSQPLPFPAAQPNSGGMPRHRVTPAAYAMPADDGGARPAMPVANPNPVRVAERPQITPASAAVSGLQSLKLSSHPEFTQRIGNEHPIMPALRWAKAGLPHIEAIDDYSCTLVKQERVNGELKPSQHLFLKVRHRPFSVYVYFLTPEEERGQEAIYVHGQNDGKLIAHTVGVRHKLVGAVSLKPDGILAMQGSRYPITTVGLANLVRELIAVGENDIQYGESEVQFYRGAKVNGYTCTCVEFKHPVRRREFRYHIARIFVDDDLNLPVHYEAYDWPEQPGGEPVLTERYTYLNLKLNNGFTDADFNPQNPNYGFTK